MIKVIQGDITKITADAIVNAANRSLLGGGGVDGAIHRACGAAVLEACKKIVANQGGCNTGEAVITTAGNLPAKFVIHTVGPIWYGGHRNEEADLAKAYLNSLRLAAKNGAKKISFPNISTGAYRFPKDRAAKIAIATVVDFLKNENTIEEVVFVCFESDNLKIYQGLLTSN